MTYAPEAPVPSYISPDDTFALPHFTKVTLFDDSQIILFADGTYWKVLPNDAGAHGQYKSAQVHHPSITPSPRDLIRRSRIRLGRAHRIRISGTSFTLPRVLHQLTDAINESSSIPRLEDNWDGEGARGYQYATWHRAVKFLIETAEWAWEVLGDVVPPPKISPGPDGSIDLDWTLPHRELLINISEQIEQPAGFYGDDGDLGSPIEGKFHLGESHGWIAAWLMQR